MRAHVAVFLVSVFTAASNALPDSSPIIDLGYARYQGGFNSTSNITNFFGVRYAAPPTGGNRFQAPQLPGYNSSLQVADTTPPECPQGTAGFNSSNPFAKVLGGSNTVDAYYNISKSQNVTEDCLFLNIHVSGRINPAAKMPVVFWIHGGGYAQGSSATMNGSYLINEAGGGIVAVEVQYRLGIFGFLPGSEVKKKGALNAGLLDQQAALQWVQKFIHLFGGDPAQVTIWGESAGAGSVLQHLVAHGGDTQPPLFLRAITSSTFLPNQYKFDDKVPEFLFSETANWAGCSNSTDKFACLVAADVGTLETVNQMVCQNAFWGTFVTVPVIDGELIVERPIETILRGKLNADNILMVTNADEGYIFVADQPGYNFTINTAEEYVTNLMPTFDSAQVQRVVDLYKGPEFNTTVSQASAIMGESIFVCPTYALLNSFKGSTRKGYVALPPGTHGVDLPYYFPDAGNQTFVNPVFQRSFAGAFAGMIKFGDPNVHPVEGIITPEWPLYQTTKPGTEMLFNRTENYQPDIRLITSNPDVLARCEVWKELAPTIPQ